MHEGADANNSRDPDTADPGFARGRSVGGRPRATITAPGRTSAPPERTPRRPTLLADRSGPCDLVLDGNIAEGVPRRFDRHFRASSAPQPIYVLPLPARRGGDLREAVQIAQFVPRTQRRRLRPWSGRSDLRLRSAVIFLAGNAPAGVGAFPQRFPIRGKLLFIRPSRPEQILRSGLLAYLTIQPPTRGLAGSDLTPADYAMRRA